MTAPVAAASSGTGARVAVFAAGAAWVAVLGALVLTSANPVVVNRAQILSSSLIAIGHRDPQKPDQLVITRLLLGAEPAREITVRDWPEICPPGEIIVPLVRVPNEGFRVTQGELPNPPAKIGQNAEAALVRPLVYPATDEVIAQVADLVGVAPAR
ncbi:MAG TPA: hypothetical protein VFG20_19445 [Planctomycetaceae bacterium]|nr:hypothetical protein [Planctomycetaceae bacterium]